VIETIGGATRFLVEYMYVIGERREIVLENYMSEKGRPVPSCDLLATTELERPEG